MDESARVLPPAALRDQAAATEDALSRRTCLPESLRRFGPAPGDRPQVTLCASEGRQAPCGFARNQCVETCMYQCCLFANPGELPGFLDQFLIQVQSGPH